MVKRLTEKELLDRINYLWQQFHERPEMISVNYEDFKKECLEEYRKQQQMYDKQLDNYRKDNYNNLIKETDKLTTKEEKQKLNEQDNQTITQIDEIKAKSHP